MTKKNKETLADLPIGGTATVAELRCGRQIGCRLMEMGLLPGTRIEVVRVAPLGDPIEIRLRGYALSLRHEEAAQLLLAPSSAVPAPASHAVEAVEAVEALGPQ